MDDLYIIKQISNNFINNNSDKILKMLIGGGNQNYMEMNDYDKFFGLYDISITNFNECINTEITTPLAINIDFNNLQQMEILAQLLPNRFSKIIIDYSTNKFMNWNIKHIDILYKLLHKNGELYFDITVYQNMVLMESHNRNTIFNKFFDFDFKNNCYHVSPIEELFYTVYVSIHPNWNYQNTYILPTKIEFVNHNINLLKKIGFETNICNEIYPLTNQICFNKNIFFIKAKK